MSPQRSIVIGGGAFAGLALALALGHIESEEAARITNYGEFLEKHPADQEALRKDAALIPSAVEELFRAYAVVNTNRYTTRDAEFAGVTMKRGDNVTCSTILASRDPREFPNPNEVIFSRSPNLHNAFSYGPHRCLGSHLARREITAGIEEWMRIRWMPLVPRDERERADAMLSELATASTSESLTLNESLILGARLSS